MTVLQYCEHLDKNAIIPAQVPLLIDFLCMCNIGDQLASITPSLATTESIPCYPGELTPAPEGLRSDLDCVYILSRCLYYHVLPPPIFIHHAILQTGKSWSQVTYDQAVECFQRFTKKLDIQVISALSHHCMNSTVEMTSFPIVEFKLSEDDRARFYALSSFSDREVRLRLALIQHFNQCLLRVVHLVELINTKKDGMTTLGKFISGLSGYIFPSVKENFLELSITQTVYRGKDAYPIVELDNRRVYTDMERSEQLSGDTESKSAITSQCFFAQLFRQMQQYSVDVMRAPLDSRERLLSVKYKGEQGLDWGGLYRDTIERW